MHLTQLLLPALLATANSVGEARVVNVVSRLHTRGTNAAMFAPPAKYGSWNAYGQSKLALVHATREMQRRYGAQGLQANALHPGAVFTDIANKGLAGHPMVGAVRRVLRPVEALFLLTPEEGAQTSVFVATQPGLERRQVLRQVRAGPRLLGGRRPRRLRASLGRDARLPHRTCLTACHTSSD